MLTPLSTNIPPTHVGVLESDQNAFTLPWRRWLQGLQGTNAATGVTAGTYGDSSHVGQFTVDATGRLLFAGNVPIASSAGGTVTAVAINSLTGTLSIAGSPITSSGAINLEVLSAPIWTTARTLSFTGDATGSGSVDGSANVATALTLATVNANVGTFGDATHVARVTLNAKGLATAASAVAITGLAPAGGASGYVLTKNSTADYDYSWAAASAGTVTHTAGALTAGRLIVGNGGGDITIGLTDVTTDNVSITAHGLAPKAPNDATKYLNGVGAYSVPPGTGTVTSVGLAAPAIFTVSGSPVTTTGTLTLTLATQAANLVWAGPTTGAAAAPTFRALVSADLPTIAGRLIGVQRFTASGTSTYTPTAGTASVVVEVLGAGGGSSGISSPGAGKVSMGRAGGGGAWALRWYTSGFSGGTVIVGAKGTGGASGDNAGASGGLSSFAPTSGTTVTGGGGTGGNNGGSGLATFPNFSNSVPGGTATNGEESCDGTGSLFGLALTSTFVLGGSGGGNRYCFGGAGTSIFTVNATAAGSAPTGPGAGGGAPCANGTGGAQAGANGSDGVVYIWEYS